jgi:sugar phosphate isomerase/epimerase
MLCKRGAQAQGDDMGYMGGNPPHKTHGFRGNPGTAPTGTGRSGLASLERLSLNQATIPSWSVAQAAEGCARAGVGWLGLWRHRVAEVGLEASARALGDAGVRASSLCRGGWFLAAEAGGPADRRSDNRRAVEEAAALGAPVLVLVCGPAPDRDLVGARARIGEAVAELSEHAQACGVRLGVEPLHPMYCGDRSVIVTLAQAASLARTAGHEAGVVVDTYHVWWDPDLAAQIAAAGDLILGYHLADWLVPTPDMLNGRGLPGDGLIDFGHINRLVAAAGYRGPVEVEIFNPKVWAMPGHETLRRVVERYVPLGW